jgi:hypothetical protein
MKAQWRLVDTDDGHVIATLGDVIDIDPEMLKNTWELKYQGTTMILPVELIERTPIPTIDVRPTILKSKDPIVSPVKTVIAEIARED